jgi:hypothetical protein
VHEVCLVLLFHKLEMARQRWRHGVGQHGDAVPVTLAGAHHDPMRGEVHVFDPEVRAFQQSEARAVEHDRHQPRQAVEVLFLYRNVLEHRALNAWFCVDAATFPWTARELRN